MSGKYTTCMGLSLAPYTLIVSIRFNKVGFYSDRTCSTQQGPDFQDMRDKLKATWQRGERESSVA